MVSTPATPLAGTDGARGSAAPFGLIGVGQLGSSLGRGLCEAGVPVVAYNLPTDAQAQARAEAAGLQWTPTPAGLSAARLVFCAVTPMAAVEAARACAPALAPDAIYVDLNSMGPQQKRAVAEAVQAAGRRFVDGAVLGAAADGIRMPIILSGADAAGVAGLLAPLGMKVRAVGAEAGQAAAIKIVRSVLAKGLEVLYAEALVAARRMGVEGEVLGTFCDWLDARPAAASAELLVTTHLLHAERRMHELDMSIDSVRETGLAPVMAQAVRDRLAATAATGVAAGLGGKPPATLADALALLDAALGRET
jgi:3-hydroxyisobutyrate dehydrogenase-like beta-hydroxyacid dehydrogenase